jgi:hypothetical protein
MFMLNVLKYNMMSGVEFESLFLRQIKPALRSAKQVFAFRTAAKLVWRNARKTKTSSAGARTF